MVELMVDLMDYQWSYWTVGRKAGLRAAHTVVLKVDLKGA